MNKFKAFVKKEFYHIFRDKRTMLILFGMPIVQILLFGFVITTEIKDVEIAIWDKSKDEVTQKITNKILGSGYFKLVKNIDNEQEIYNAFKKGTIKEALIFENNFAQNLNNRNNANIQIITDASDPNIANLIVNYTSAIVYSYTGELNSNLTIPMQIKTESTMLYNSELKSVFMFVPGTMAMILMLVSAMITSIAITREKELGTMEVLLVSPLKVSQIIIGKVAPYIVLSIINVITIIALAMSIFHMPIVGSLSLLIAVSILFIFMALSLGILISTVTNDQQTAMMISMFALMLPTILLSGFIFPVENMPKILQWLTVIIPPKYYISAIKDIMLKGSGLSYIWKDVAVLFLMTLVLLGLSIKKFKIRLE